MLKNIIRLLQNINAPLSRLFVAGSFLLLFIQNSLSQNQLEFANGSYPSAPNGLTIANQTASLLENSSNGTFATYVPSITVTASFSNQQFTSIPSTIISTSNAMNFGGRANSISNTANQVPVFNLMNAVNNPSSSNYTSNSNGPTSTGIDVTTNSAFYFYNSVYDLFNNNASINGRFYFGDITLTFSSPISNPMLQIVGLGASVNFGGGSVQGFTSELELQTSSVTLSKLSGTSELDVTSNKILNSATNPSLNCGAGAACGSVKVIGTNITTLTFKVFVRGDGGGQEWGHTAINAGDEFLIGVSLNMPNIIRGNVFNDANGLIDNTINGTGTNLSNSLFANLVDENNLIVASTAIATDGSYSFTNIGDGNYTIILTTIQGTQGNAASSASLPTGWINTGENIGINAGNDGVVNGVIPISVSSANISNANFGIVFCSNLMTSISSSSVNTTACLGTGFTLTSTAAINYQWYRDSTPIVGANAQTYIPTVSGTYTMHVITGGGVCNISSNPISVIINYAATPIITPSDTANTCVANNDKICPAVWGYSNYQWYKEGVLIAAPNGTSSCLYPTSAGNYTLAAQDGAGCWSLQSASVYVKLDTVCSSGSVTTGVSGGVESKGLGDVIAQRLYGNAKASRVELDGIGRGVKFTHSGTVLNGINDIALDQIIPNTVIGTNNSYISTPTDLVSITNAQEVFAVDYTQGSSIKAVAFATKTLGEVYNHTKPICDRLKGAELLEVKTVMVKGYSLMTYKIHQRTGEIEYAINLSAGTHSNRDNISLQSNWFTDSYVQDETLYNFQLWAVNYNMVTALASDIIGKLQERGTVIAVTATDLPKAYISKGYRKETNLYLTFQNNTSNTKGYFELREKANENSTVSIRQIPFTINANGVSNINIGVKDHYEGNIYVYLNNALTDLAYLSDGTWSLDYNKNNTSINKFVVTNEANVRNADNEHRLLRNVSVSGVSKDYITVYKTMIGGGLPVDVSKYKALVFTTQSKGASSVTVTLVKKSISQWSKQYSYTQVLEGDKEYSIAYNQFKAQGSSTSLDASDIIAVNFAYNVGRQGVSTALTIDISEARFSDNTTTAAPANGIDIVVSPNPNKGIFMAQYQSIANQNLVLKVVEAASGRVIKTQFIRAVQGQNQTRIEINNNLSLASANYIVTLEGDGVKYKPAKMMIGK
jgi:hypothetical protein